MDLEVLYKDAFESDPYLEVEARANEEKIGRILELKAEKNVLILAHNYMHPLIFRLSDPDARGDSLSIARYAARTDKPIILFDGVMFMAETAKILNPQKKVLIASKKAGCSLADPIREKDVRRIKRQYPNTPVVTYINSYADVKAESDICCTSANALEVILSLDSDRVIFLPDSLMGANLQEELSLKGHEIEVIYPGKDNDLNQGTCEVHDKFTLQDVLNIREQHGISKNHHSRAILAHWECHPDVLREADFYGSTSEMVKYIRETSPEKVFLATECEMAANLASEFPQTEFIKQCNVHCQHMKQITLDGMLSALETEDPEKHEVFVEETIRVRAFKPIKRMLELNP